MTYTNSNLTLRDKLAIDRTTLANKRTFLSFVRTALTMAVLGFSLLKFFAGDVYTLISFFLLISAIITLIAGVKYYVEMKVLLELAETDDPIADIQKNWITLARNQIINKLSFAHLRTK